MSIEETILYERSMAAGYAGTSQCDHHTQMVEWLEELVELRRKAKEFDLGTQHFPCHNVTSKFYPDWKFARCPECECSCSVPLFENRKK